LLGAAVYAVPYHTPVFFPTQKRPKGAGPLSGAVTTPFFCHHGGSIKPINVSLMYTSEHLSAPPPTLISPFFGTQLTRFSLLYFLMNSLVSRRVAIVLGQCPGKVGFVFLFLLFFSAAGIGQTSNVRGILRPALLRYFTVTHLPPLEQRFLPVKNLYLYSSLGALLSFLQPHPSQPSSFLSIVTKFLSFL